MPTTTHDARDDRQLVLCNVSASTYSFADLLATAVAGGFDAISVSARTHRRALRHEGLTDETMRRAVADHGLRVSEVEAAGDWLSPPDPDGPAWLAPVYSTVQTLDAAAALGASSVLAVHFGSPAPVDVAAARFADLCDSAAAYGLQVGLEFVAFATIADVHVAWDVVRLADRPNGGLVIDNWHHRRSTNDDEAIWQLPPGRVVSVQLSDGRNPPVGPPIEDVTHRRLPGSGDLDVAAFYAGLQRMGVVCPVGIEVFDASLLARGPADAGRTLGAALRAAIGRDSVSQ